jgi:hypothetical protein
LLSHDLAEKPIPFFGRWAQLMIKNAEALESAAALLRQVEAQVIDESVRK